MHQKSKKFEFCVRWVSKFLTLKCATQTLSTFTFRLVFFFFFFYTCQCVYLKELIIILFITYLLEKTWKKHAKRNVGIFFVGALVCKFPVRPALSLFSPLLLLSRRLPSVVVPRTVNLGGGRGASEIREVNKSRDDRLPAAQLFKQPRSLIGQLIN